jgi:hypothetical protein
MMSDQKKLKSAYELAMERLRAEDREQGVDKPAVLSDEQKREIAELRARAKAKLAEIEIMHHEQRTSLTGDPAEAEKLEERFQIDRRRVDSKLESDVARVRRGEHPGDD